MTKRPDRIKCIGVTWEGHADCQHCEMRKDDILADVDVEKNKLLLNRITQMSFAKKAILFVQHSPANALYVVRKGMVKLEISLPDGGARIVRLIGEAGIAGLETLLNNGQRYDQTAIAIQDTEICRIPFKVINQLAIDDPEFYKAVMSEWHHQIEASDKIIINFSTGAVKQRLTALFLMLIGEAKRKSQIEIPMFPIDDIAALTGVTRESVSRILSELKRKKLLIKSSPGKMKFDEEGFKEIAKNYSD